MTVDACLDPGAVQAALAPLLPALDAVRIAGVRRNTSHRRNPHPLLVRYELCQAGAWSAWHGRVHRDGASAAAHPGAPVLRVPALDLLLWPWPHDPGLPQLPALLASRAGDAVEVLRWVPEVRALLRFSGPGGVRYAKTFADDRAAAVHARLAHFAALAEGPLVGAPLALDAALRTVWQAPVAGVPLVASTRPAAALAEALAQALAVLHAAPAALAGPERRDTAHGLHEAARRVHKLGRALPGLHARAQRVLQALQQHPPAARLGLLHGDFHAGQVAEHEGRIVLFDFDEFALGDPMEDLAAFAVRAPADGAFVARLVAAYAQVAPAAYCRARLDWHLALQHLLQAARAFGFQIPHWPHEAARRLARAEALLAPPEMHPC